jgi:uncharacterized protein DUF4231
MGWPVLQSFLDRDEMHAPLNRFVSSQLLVPSRKARLESSPVLRAATPRRLRAVAVNERLSPCALLTRIDAPRTVGVKEGCLPVRTVLESGRGEEAPKVGQPALSSAQVRLEDQIVWYDAKSGQNQRWFKALKTCQIVVAAAIPVAAAASAPVWLMGAGGAVIVVLEGLQQLQQYQQNWIAYRSTCERLKHEKFLFLSRAGPYGGVPNPESLLAERVEGLVSQEHAAWVSHREEGSKQAGGGG